MSDPTQPEEQPGPPSAGTTWVSPPWRSWPARLCAAAWPAIRPQARGSRPTAAPTRSPRGSAAGCAAPR
ncbi:MAG: hypothetical protein WCI67_09245 [Chloroflexales bacterium]